MKIEDVQLKELRELYSREKSEKIKQRLHIILLLKEGYVQRDVSKILHISIGKVPFWKKRFEKGGFKGLKNKQKSGRPTKLSKKVIHKLSNRLKNIKSKEKEIIRAGWNTKQIRDAIEEETSIKYTLRHTRRLSKKLGLSLITPRSKHIKRDEEKIKAFKEQFKKKLKMSIKDTQ